MQGEHGVPNGKLLPYEPSTRVPLIVRGPGIPAGAVSHELVGNVDLAPTIAGLAEALPGRSFDGRSLLPYARDPRRCSRRALLHETGGRHFVRRRDHDAGVPAVRRVLSYRGVRTQRWLYVEYRNGERKLYDRVHDPHELRSVHADPAQRRTVRTLRATLRRLAHCRGPSCRTAPARGGEGGAVARESGQSRDGPSFPAARADGARLLVALRRRAGAARHRLRPPAVDAVDTAGG
jgi:arylsulfatase A-like enzyme